MRTGLIHSIGEMRQFTAAARRDSRLIGCVPTMGALHEGHGALVERACSHSDLVVVTIFVNPIQFDRPEDYERYTRNLEEDRGFCEARNVDTIFAPSAAEMYPAPLATFVEPGDLARHLCGAFRPGHFRGVASVVAKLFNIVQPDAAFFGEKDAQQLAVIQQMVYDLNFPIEIVPVPTVREPDGLALSSRNRRLTQEERRTAPILFKALMEGRRLIAGGETESARIRAAVTGILESASGLRIEYIEVVDHRMQPVESISTHVRLAAAIWLGSTRLIDNVRCTAPGSPD